MPSGTSDPIHKAGRGGGGCLAEEGEVPYMKRGGGGVATPKTPCWIRLCQIIIIGVIFRSLWPGHHAVYSVRGLDRWWTGQEP